MRALVDAVEAGAFGEISGILHIGIGGSLLGPALLVDALGRDRCRHEVRFVGNVDPQVLADATAALDPATMIPALNETPSFLTGEAKARSHFGMPFSRPSSRASVVTSRRSWELPGSSALGALACSCASSGAVNAASETEHTATRRRPRMGGELCNRYARDETALKERFATMCRWRLGARQAEVGNERRTYSRGQGGLGQ
jgi:hypothetical protein